MYEHNDLSGAAYNHQRAAELSELRGFPENVADSYLVLARTKIAQGDSKAALAAMDKANRLLEYSSTIRPRVRAFCAALQGWIAIRRGDITLASRWSHHLSEYADILPFSFQHYRSRLQLAKGDKVGALEQLESQYRGAVQAKANGLIIAVRTYQALAAETPAMALGFLTEALTLGEPEGYVRTFVDEGKLLIPLLRKAAGQGIMPTYTNRLISIIEGEQNIADNGTANAQPFASSSIVLSEREIEVLQLVQAGLSNPQISDRLFVTTGTIKAHVYNIMEKLDVRSRTQAVTKARELKII
jgi:LuxR family maltose regulon positive regulatory protein